MRTADQCYLLAAQSFQDMNDWVNCLRLVAFGQQQQQHTSKAQQTAAPAPAAPPSSSSATPSGGSTVVARCSNAAVDLLLERRSLAAVSSAAPNAATGAAAATAHVAASQVATTKPLTTASQAVAAAQTALARSRQRQPSLLGSCKPQPPIDSPFIRTTHAPPERPKSGATSAKPAEGSASSASSSLSAVLSAIGELDHVIDSQQRQQEQSMSAAAAAAATLQVSCNKAPKAAPIAATTTTTTKPLDEEEENMLYCSIEDNPAEHNYRVKVIETELAVRCQLKCYQLTEPNNIHEQYEELAHFNSSSSTAFRRLSSAAPNNDRFLSVTFYQLIIGPQELTLLNDYAISTFNRAPSQHQQQGLWSWPYQCIRRYGFDKDNCFMFEAGRKCTSGPGQFIVQTPKAHLIYQDVVKFVNELRSLTDGSMAAVAPQPPQPASSRPAPQQQQLGADPSKMLAPSVVTQIPVAWVGAGRPINEEQSTMTASAAKQASDASSSAGVAEQSGDCRRQFFDSLHQHLDSATTTQTAPNSEHAKPEHPSERAQVTGSQTRVGLAAAATAAAESSTQNAVISHETNTNGRVGQSAALRARQSFSTLSTPVPPSASSATGAKQSDSGETKRTTTTDTSSKAADNGLKQSATARLVASSGTPNSNRQRVGAQNQSTTTPTDAPVGRHESSGADGGRQEQLEEKSSDKLHAVHSVASNTGASVNSDELSTDESGYEHGDESVDGSAKSITAAMPTGAQVISGGSCGARRRQSNAESIGSSLSPSSSSSSSSSSTSSSLTSNAESGKSLDRARTIGSGGAPVASGYQAALKRSQLSANGNSQPLKANAELKQQQLLKLHSLIAENSLGDQHGDFEANLIRDVYSEITKLHAEFAVTSGGSSNEDSMSSKSSCGGGTETDTTRPVNDEDLSGTDLERDEPTYSNVRATGGLVGRRVDMSRFMSRRVAHDDDDDDDDGDEGEDEDEDDFGYEQQHRSRRYTSQSMPNFDLDDDDDQSVGLARSRCIKAPAGHAKSHPHVLSRWGSNGHNNSSSLSVVRNDMNQIHHQSQIMPLPSRFPTVLNPIPECGEPTVAQHQMTRQKSQTNLSQAGNTNNKKAAEFANRTTTPNNNNNNSSIGDPSDNNNKMRFYQKQANGVVKPTKHYVINDVQYAKISRNLRSRYDSCLQ